MDEDDPGRRAADFLLSKSTTIVLLRLLLTTRRSRFPAKFPWINEKVSRTLPESRRRTPLSVTQTSYGHLRYEAYGKCREPTSSAAGPANVGACVTGLHTTQGLV